LAAPPGPRVVYEVWFIALAVIGARFPGPANQVTLARAYLALPGLLYGLSPGGLPIDQWRCGEGQRRG